MASQDTLGDSNETVDADPIGRDDADEIQSEKESVELTDDLIEDARDRLCHDPRSMPLSLRAPVSLACKELLPILEPMVNRDSNEINQMHVYMSLYSTFMKAARLWSARRITNQWQETGYASWSHTVYKEQSVLYMLPPDVQNLILAKLEAETEAMTRCLCVIAEGADDQLGFIAEEQIKLDLAAEQLWDSDY